MTEQSQLAGFLEEYKELRAEIRLLLKRRARSIHFVLLLTAAVVGLPAGVSTPPLPFVAAALVAFLWFDEVRRLRAIFRIAAYLEVCVEPHVPGLNYETSCARHPIQTSFVGRVVANGLFPAAFLLHSGIGFYRYGTAWPPPVQIAFFVLVGLALVLLTWASYRTSTSGRRREVEWWRRRPVADA